MTFFEVVQLYGMGLLSALTFMVNIIVELTKNVGILKKVPTDAYTIVLSVALTCVSYFIIIGNLGVAVVWYEIVLAILAGFPIAYISMYGWEKMNSIWQRFNTK